MKLYRQTARFVLFGLVIVAMVFGIQNAAMAGAGPEPKDPPNAKAKYLPAPYIVDFVAKIQFTDINISAVAKLDITVTHQGKKACTVSTGNTSREKLYTLSGFELETSKEFLLSTYYGYMSYTDSQANPTQEPLFCNMVDTDNPLHVIAVAEYKKIGNPTDGITVTARLIVMEVTY
jgi:hypothetical protein